MAYRTGSIPQSVQIQDWPLLALLYRTGSHCQAN